MIPNFVKIGRKIDNQLVVIKRHIVERNFFEANPQRYDGLWIECPTVESGLYDPQIGDFYDAATGLFTPQNGDWTSLDDVIPVTPSE